MSNQTQTTKQAILSLVTIENAAAWRAEQDKWIFAEGLLDDAGISSKPSNVDLLDEALDALPYDGKEVESFKSLGSVILCGVRAPEGRLTASGEQVFLFDVEKMNGDNFGPLSFRVTDSVKGLLG